MYRLLSVDDYCLEITIRALIGIIVSTVSGSFANAAKMMPCKGWRENETAGREKVSLLF